MIKWKKSLSVILLSAGLAFGTSAMAATAWVSVPSTPDASDKVTIAGGNLAAGTVTVQIVDPNGTTSSQVEAVAADGSFKVDFLPGMPGGYQVMVLDQAGTVIGKGNFGYIK
jgi:hypothetical protein